MVESRLDDGAVRQGESDKETMLIRNLTVHGFKSIMQEQPIELGRVNCFIGANGVGKSKAAAEHKHAENKRNYFFHVQFVLSRKSIYCSICKLRLC